jgi:hypothetical protein
VLPITFNDDIQVTTQLDQVDRTYKMDFENNRIIGFVNGQDSVIQSVIKKLSTKKDTFKIYLESPDIVNQGYGFEGETLLSKGYTNELIQIELDRMIKETIAQESRVKEIVSIDYINYNYNGSIEIKIVLNTIYGQLETEVSV